MTEELTLREQIFGKPKGSITVRGIVFNAVTESFYENQELNVELSRTSSGEWYCHAGIGSWGYYSHDGHSTPEEAIDNLVSVVKGRQKVLTEWLGCMEAWNE